MYYRLLLGKQKIPEFEEQGENSEKISALCWLKLLLVLLFLRSLLMIMAFKQFRS